MMFVHRDTLSKLREDINENAAKIKEHEKLITENKGQITKNKGQIVENKTHHTALRDSLLDVCDEIKKINQQLSANTKQSLLKHRGYSMVLNTLQNEQVKINESIKKSASDVHARINSIFKEIGEIHTDCNDFDQKLLDFKTFTTETIKVLQRRTIRDIKALIKSIEKYAESVVDFKSTREPTVIDNYDEIQVILDNYATAWTMFDVAYKQRHQLDDEKTVQYITRKTIYKTNCQNIKREESAEIIAKINEDIDVLNMLAKKFGDR